MKALSVLKNFQNEVNQLFDKSFFSINRPTFALTDEIDTWCPEVDIADQGTNYQVKANLPGVEPKDLEVYFNNKVLSIKGKLESKREEKYKNYLQCERSYGEFSRLFSLPEASDDEKIEAEFKNGVLNINIPKIKNSSPKRIEIKS